MHKMDAKNKNNSLVVAHGAAFTLSITAHVSMVQQTLFVAVALIQFTKHAGISSFLTLFITSHVCVLFLYCMCMYFAFFCIHDKQKNKNLSYIGVVTNLPYEEEVEKPIN